MTRWVDWFLPYDFEVFHTPSITLGTAEYLSRHSSPYEGSNVKAEQLFNDWFTVNVAEDFEKGFRNVIGKRHQPIKIERAPNFDKRVNRQLLTVDSVKANSTVKPEINKLNNSHNAFKSSKIDETASSSKIRETNIARIWKIYLLANYQEIWHLVL